METKSEVQTGFPDSCTLLGGQPRSGTTLLSSIMRRTREHFRTFELHIEQARSAVKEHGLRCIEIRYAD